MAIFIPTPGPVYSEITVSLGGETYNIVYTYNEIDEAWRLSLYTYEGDVVVEGVKIVANQFLVWRHQLELFNHGQIACFKFALNSKRPPTRDNLGIGKEHTLVYLTNAELET